MKSGIDIDLKIEVESLLGKLGIDHVYDSELMGWLFRDGPHIIFMSVSEIVEDKFISFFVKLGELKASYSSQELFDLLNENMRLAFASFALNGKAIYMKYTTQIKELDSEEFIVALKVVSFSIEKCTKIVKKLVKPS